MLNLGFREKVFLSCGGYLVRKEKKQQEDSLVVAVLVQMELLPGQLFPLSVFCAEALNGKPVNAVKPIDKAAPAKTAQKRRRILDSHSASCLVIFLLPRTEGHWVHCFAAKWGKSPHLWIIHLKLVQENRWGQTVYNISWHQRDAVTNNYISYSTHNVNFFALGNGFALISKSRGNVFRNSPQIKATS